MDYAGKIAVVTGGASGIGLALGAGLKARGAEVVLADIREDVLQPAAQEIGATGIAVDVTDEASVNALADQVRDRFGGCDVLCANAGVGTVGGAISARAADLKWLMDVNLWGTLHTLRAFTPLMEPRAEKAMLITASMVSLTPPAENGFYEVTKHMVLAIAENAMAELGPKGFQVTAFCPGLVDSNIWNGKQARPSAYGGARDLPHEIGANWRDNGASPTYVAEAALDDLAAGESYCVVAGNKRGPDIEARHAAIMAAYNKRAED
ncbi:MAG: SDR family oxidoreductase [Alphaproteobacteria bacterium]